jgi:CheY-like chemotaxis protein
MLGYAGMLENRLEDPDLKRFASAVVLAAKCSGELTRNLLSFSRQGHVESAPIDMHELIGEVIDILGHSIEKRIAIKTSLEAAFAFIQGDPASLQNTLLNLALNARDAMPEGGSLGFATEAVEIPGKASLPANDGLTIFRDRWRDIDLVILDMAMEDSDGTETFHELKRIQPDAKAILFSGYSPAGKVESLLEKGGKGFLQKPFVWADLEKMIASAIA